MFFMTIYIEVQNEMGVVEPKCLVGAGDFWPDFYALAMIVIFFLLPLIILLITYGFIAQKLNQDRSALNAKNENYRGRKQVVLMLGTVVFTFFLCLLPFRVFTVVVLVSDLGQILQRHSDSWYSVLFFTRIMTYVNSALNPILYNIMSSKFRNGFLRLCGRRRKQYIFHRNGTFLTLTTTASNNLSNNMNNNMSHAHVLAPNYSSSPSTSPELIMSTSLIRKNGVLVRKFDQPPLYKYSHSQHGRHGQAGEGSLRVGYLGTNTSISSSNGGGSRKERKHASKTIINPKSLNKKYIYSYVSGHKSESML
jgi:hypothetical protein